MDYYRGNHKAESSTISALLKASGKVANKVKRTTTETGKGKDKKRESNDTPVTGPYFIIVKDPTTKKEEKEEGKEEEEEEEEGKEEELDHEEEEEEESGIQILFYPEQARYTNIGDLQIGKKGEDVIDIPIANYRPLTANELFKNLDRPDRKIKDAQKAFNEAYTQMRIALKEAGHPNLKRSMNALQAADDKLLNAKFAEHAIYTEIGVPINTLLFDRRRDDSLIDEIGRFIGSKIKLIRRYVTDAAPSAEIPMGLRPNIIVINMPNDINGILSSFYNQAAIDIDGIVYSSPYKAILDQLINELGPEKAHFKEVIQSIENPQDLKEQDPLIREGVKEEKVNAALEVIIEEVYRNALQQNPIMADTLKATGDAFLVIIPQERQLDPFLGIGIDPNDTDSINNPRKWRGNNIYGKILMKLRKEFVPELDVPVIIDQGANAEENEEEEELEPIKQIVAPAKATAKSAKTATTKTVTTAKTVGTAATVATAATVTGSEAPKPFRVKIGALFKYFKTQEEADAAKKAYDDAKVTGAVVAPVTTATTATVPTKVKAKIGAIFKYFDTQEAADAAKKAYNDAKAAAKPV